MNKDITQEINTTNQTEALLSALITSNVSMINVLNAMDERQTKMNENLQRIEDNFKEMKEENKQLQESQKTIIANQTDIITKSEEIKNELTRFIEAIVNAEAEEEPQPEWVAQIPELIKAFEDVLPLIEQSSLNVASSAKLSSETNKLSEETNRVVTSMDESLKTYGGRLASLDLKVTQMAVGNDKTESFDLSSQLDELKQTTLKLNQNT